MQTGKPIITHMPIDSVESLEEAKLPPGAARAIVRVIANHVTEAVSRLATKDDLEEFKVAMKGEADEFRTEMRQEFAELRIDVQRQMFKWFLAFLGVMLPAYTSLAFFVVQYVKK